MLAIHGIAQERRLRSRFLHAAGLRSGVMTEVLAVDGGPSKYVGPLSITDKNGNDVAPGEKRTVPFSLSAGDVRSGGSLILTVTPIIGTVARNFASLPVAKA
jgi:hypothetical protein